MSTSSIVILGNPRSGTTYLLRLLASHNDVQTVGEPLNDEIEFTADPFEYVDGVLADVRKPIVGFKCFPEQLIDRNVRLDDLLRHLRCSTVVVVWRRNLLEMFVSRKIAHMTGEWYSESPAAEVHQVRIDETEFLEFADNLKREWSIMGSEWPIEVIPLFVAYEDIANDGAAAAASVLSNVGLELKNVVFKTSMQRQNPSPLKDKISNWDELSEETKRYRVDVTKILSEAIFNSIPGSQEYRHLLPDREPPIPAGGWLYRVAEPYLPPEARRNVMDSLDGNCISSAGWWPKDLASRLRTLFGRPVAQPCVNGFAALVLALQAVGVGPGDEVILPTFTMIAVPNCVNFVGATPIVVDNAMGQYNPGIKQILEAATEKTKAVIVSHTYGVPMDGIAELADICRQRKWTLIEDVAETVGIREKVTGKLLGTFGDFACASMYANKIVNAGDGGFIIAADPKYDGKLASLVNHGFTRSFHFLHLEPAINAKINGMGAAAAAGVLERLDDIMAHRRRVAQRYRSRLASTPLRLMPECGLGDTPWVFGVVCETKSQRNALRRHLAINRIETRDFFLPVHLQPASEKMIEPERRRKLKLPVSEKLGSTGFYLPFFTNLSLQDIDHICDAVISFFDQRRKVGQAPKKNAITSVRVKPGDYSLQVVEFDRSGRPLHRRHHAHPLIEAVMLKTRFERSLFQEAWDERQSAIEDIRFCVDQAGSLNLDLNENFNSILEYLKIQENVETDPRRFWLQENIDEGDFAQVANIPTTTDRETLQFLVWLIEKTKSKRVLELGGWLGRASGLFGATVLKNAKSIVDDRSPVVYTLDSFYWQAWMNVYLPKAGFRVNESFIAKFKDNLKSLGDVIQPREWEVNVDRDESIDNGVIPDDAKFDLVFVDFSEEPEDIEKAWPFIKNHCLVDRTIIVFNGFVVSIFPFFNKHHHELRPIPFKPHTTARAFLFVQPPADQAPGIDYRVPTLKRKLAFLESPDWSHHHKNAFVAAVSKLRDQFHDETASTAFLPAVEDYLCEHADEDIDRPWIGIVHQIPHHKELFYHADLYRLCANPAYRASLSNCRGLFTLTQLQADYLRKHLPQELGIPVCQLTYPSLLDAGNVSASKSKLVNWNGDSAIKLAFIGSFARDIDLFYEARVPKHVHKALIAGDEQLKKWAQMAPKEVQVLDRMDETEYENLLENCLAFLSLKYDGAANTLIVECIARGTPIVAPNYSSCIDYLGDQYPLYYDHSKKSLDLTKLITPEKIRSAIDYLTKIDKSKFSVDHFCRSVNESAVMINVVPEVENRLFGLSTIDSEILFPKFDITICICSYKRTHHFPDLLDRLWNRQDFPGSIQILIWNNNESRHNTLKSICGKYLSQPTKNRKLELIQSTQNYYCAIRTCTPALMNSDRLLICDDDIIPNENFVQFFYSASQKYPEDVLCCRGHKFFEHELNLKNPYQAWRDYENLRFVNDDQPMQFVHFVHADACLLPKMALREWASIEAPDPTFALVDDYWMSFILNHQFGRNLRKLCMSRTDQPPFDRTDDSDTKGLALHTRPEVLDARIRLYMHHMLRGWPKWPKVKSIADLSIDQIEELKEKKRSPWKKAFVGFNVSSKLTPMDADDLLKLGVKNVRMGAVGVKKQKGYDFSGFNTKPQKQMEDLLATIDMLAEKNINVVITLDPRVDAVDSWSLIARHCFSRANVIGYDLINEPFSEMDENDGYWMDITDRQDPEGVEKLRVKYSQLIKEIDKVDPITPILLEPPFWGHVLALFRLESILESIDDESIKSRLLISFHFYNPIRYTQRRLNGGKYEYPGDVPLWGGKWSPTIKLDKNWLEGEFTTASKWAENKSWAKIVVGELGVARDVPGAPRYLKDTLDAAIDLGLPVFLFSFRDVDWEAMDYEKGVADQNGSGKNEFLDIIRQAAERAASKK